jgi:transposase
MASISVPTTPAGYRQLLAWACTLGEPVAWGVEGTSSYGAGLARFLAANHQQVVEVNQHDRQLRRRRGKSDPLDAQAAARAVQAGQATATPKASSGQVEMLRLLRIARASAVKARTQTINALKGLVVTAPEQLREQLRDLPAAQLVEVAAALAPAQLSTPLEAAMLALGHLGRRHQALTAELAALDSQLERLAQAAAPRLLGLFGVGVEVAGALLAAAGGNPGRLHSEAAFAALCGVAPVPASSGKTSRHRLSRGGDRHANAALYRIALTRLRHHQPTKDYMSRRLAEGKTRKEIIRCLKRYIAREVFTALTHPDPHSAAAAAT